jgi:predicted nuclease of predicted toxin-antitoxin system
MALRFLADHCISNTIVRALRDATHEVVRLKDVLPVDSPDATVIAKAQEIDAILEEHDARRRKAGPPATVHLDKFAFL